MTVLDPLATRWYAGPDGRVPPEPDGIVRAMPVILRLERPPAARTPVLEAAARAALAVCLDPRAAPGGEWHEAVTTWVGSRIRKIARRARGAHWDAVAELPGVTVDVDGAQVRALLPGPVDVDPAAGGLPRTACAANPRAADRSLPRAVARLQIGGTDLPDDSPGPPPPRTPTLWIDGTLGLTVGKAAAQVGHAAMLDAAVRGLHEVPPYAVRTADRREWAHLCTTLYNGWAVAVQDAGFTEVAPGTITVIATA